MQKFFAKRKDWLLDKKELAAIQNLERIKRTHDKHSPVVLIQTPASHYFLSLFMEVIKNHSLKGSFNFEGLQPNLYTLKQKRDLLWPLRLIYSWTNNVLVNRKWTKLYHAAGVNSVSKVDHVGFLTRLRFYLRAFKIWRTLKSKDDLINLSIDGIYCGDLIYDTYLRYRVRPTVNVQSISVLYFIHSALCVLAFSEKMARNKARIVSFFSSYSTYIQHGIPVRVFLKHGIPVYTSGNFQQLFKKLSTTDVFHTKTHKEYAQDFKTLDQQKEKIELGLNMLEKKFNGTIDSATVYMKQSAYGGSPVTDVKLDFDGVVFLHDFYDSPHIYSWMLFPDFYEWVECTFAIIEKYNLNVGVKPHPNQVVESSQAIDELKRKYPSLKWIDPKTTNSQILNSGIKFGVSVYGTILHELSYHGITPICAGDNPHASFNFIQTPKSIKEYEEMIVNAKNLNLPADYREQVAAFYYMHNANAAEGFIVDKHLFTGWNVFNCSSDLFLKVTKAG
jgi:hypothetical protein